jgi:toxin YoeB
MKIVFANEAVFDDFISWSIYNKKTHKKIISLIKDISRNPYDGIGKPEQLKHELSGCWSRRITSEHRLIYQVLEDEDMLVILSCKAHYNT